MAPTGLRTPTAGGLASLQHRLRAAHPLGPAMRRTLRALDRAPAERIRAFQERRLRAMVRWAAARSPYYRDWFSRSGVDPRDVRTVDDLAGLPLLERSDLVSDPDRFLAYPARLTWTSSSSGSSGSVVRVRRTPGSSAYELAALQRQWGWFGLAPDVRRLVLRADGAGLDGDDDAVVRPVPGARQLLVSGYRLGGVDADRLLAEIRAFDPGAVEGWPSAIAGLATLLHERGERLPVGGVITSSEMTTPSQAALLREVYDAPLVDHYGQTERVCLAGSCEAGGYHLFDDYAVTEQLPVPGSPGSFELVGTPLHNWAFPLLRYRTGDTVAAAPQGPCACGRAHTRLGPVAGRAEDAFTAADGRALPMPSLVFDDVDGLRESQIAQLAPGVFEVRMVLADGVDGAAATEQVRRSVERYFGPGQSVRAHLVDRVPRSASGKLRPSVVEGHGTGGTGAAGAGGGAA